MKKIIYLTISILLLATLITLQILGSKERVGYLSDFEIIEKSASNYIYNFRIRYYDKVFRNSDIYGVYLITNNLPEYITEIKMNELGSPFGSFISTKIIEEEKIDNINYILQLKIIFVSILIFVIYFLLIFFEFASADLLKLFKIFLNKLKSINIKNYSMILILFLCFLIMPNIIYKIFYERFDHINYENRTLASKPILVSTNINEYPKSYEEYFNDYLPFKTELVKLKNLSDIFVFKNIISDSVLLGKNDWLFLKWHPLIPDYIGNYEFSNEELEIAKNNLIYFRNELKKKNIDFILMIAPNKNIIYPENMPSFISRKNENNSTDYFIRYMEDNTDIKIVYPKNELLKYKKKYQLYYKYDTHWNYLGAYVGYSELMKKMNIEVANLDIMNIELSNKNRSGDLASMISLKKKITNDNEYIIKNYDKKSFHITAHSNDIQMYAETMATNTNDYKLFIIRDSFTTAMFNYIASSFNNVTFAHYSGYFKIDYIIDKSPNILVIEVVERGLKGMVFHLIPSYKIEEINEE